MIRAERHVTLGKSLPPLPKYMPKSKNEVSVWKSADEYFAFAQKYNVYGGSAIELKRKMDKLTAIPIPKKHK